MDDLRDPLLALLFAIHLLGFVYLYIKRRQFHYLRLCALFGALMVYFVMGWAQLDADLGVVGLRALIRGFAWLMTGWSVLYYLRRFALRRAANPGPASGTEV